MNKGDLVVCIKDAVYDINCKTPQIEEWYKFDEYFITLADWRDKQIDSILNEND